MIAGYLVPKKLVLDPLEPLDHQTSTAQFIP